MLIRDLKFSSETHIWRYASVRRIQIATPGTANSVRKAGFYWIKNPGHNSTRPEGWHQDLTEFEAQAVLDHYLAGRE